MAVPYSRYFLYPVPWYSVLIVTGATLAIWLASREARRLTLPKDTILDLALWVLPFGILGARIYYVIFSWDQFRQNLLSTLYIWQGGLAIYGGLLAGILVIVIFCTKRKIPAWLLCDLLAPGVALAQSIGRWGNYFNQEAYGIPISNPAFQFFPIAVLISEQHGNVWHLATFFMESVWNILIFLFLMISRRSWFRKQGDVFLFYAFLYAAGRLIVEDFRMDSLYSSSMRISQVLSFAVILIIGGQIFFRDRSRKSNPCYIPGCFIALIALGWAVPVLFDLIQRPILPATSVGSRFLLLGGFSLLAIVSLFFIYGPSESEEVIYANH